MKKIFFENISVTVTPNPRGPVITSFIGDRWFFQYLSPSQKEARCGQKHLSPYIHTLWVHKWERHRRAAGTVPAKREHSTKGR